MTPDALPYRSRKPGRVEHPPGRRGPGASHGGPTRRVAMRCHAPGAVSAHRYALLMAATTGFVASWLAVPATSTTRDLGLKKGRTADPRGVAITPLPPCALVVFVHVHKTGGTTIRDWVNKEQQGEWKMLGFNPGNPQDEFCIGGNCVQGISKLVDLAGSNPAEYARQYGRVVIEDHGGVHDIRSSLQSVRGLRGNAKFVEHGCKALTFTVLREPKNYLISLARAHYKYSPFLDTLMHRNGPIQIDDPKWRYDLMKIPNYIDNIQVRQLGMWCSRGDKYPAFGHGNRVEKWYAEDVDQDTVARVFDMVLHHFDVVGLTQQIPELLLLLADLVGFQHVIEKPTNVIQGLHDAYKGRDWYQDEMDMLEKVAAASHHDHTLFVLVHHRWQERLSSVKNLQARLGLVKQAHM